MQHSANQRKKDPQGASTTGVSTELAEAVKALRKRMGLTQAELAHEAGVSSSFISQLERSNSDVTFNTLHRICLALNTTVGHLLAPPSPSGRLLRKENYRYLDYNGVDKWILTREEMRDVDICLFEFPEGATTGLRQPPETSRIELWICQSGFLGIEIDNDVHILRPGDSLDISEARPNSVYNAATGKCEALLIIKNHATTK